MNKYRFLAVLFCFVAVLELFSVQALAAIPIDTEKECTLKIAFVPEGVNAQNVEFKAYKVASVTASCEFTVEPEFADQEVMMLIRDPNAENYNLIASTLAGVIAADGKIKPDYTSISNSSGIAVFEKLETGLYLIIGEVFNDTNAFYTPQNFMVSLPERLNSDLWNHDVLAEVKWEKHLKNDRVNLSVLKVWSDSATNLHTNDNVTVKLYKNGEIYDTQILNKRNNWSYEWNDLDVGALWAVKEDDVKSYIGTVERKEDCFVITNTLKISIKGSNLVPKTGLLQWPVPILITCGILFLLIGINIIRKGEKQ